MQRRYDELCALFDEQSSGVELLAALTRRPDGVPEDLMAAVQYRIARPDPT